jgi:hypothetical protein
VIVDAHWTGRRPQPKNFNRKHVVELN